MASLSFKPFHRMNQATGMNTLSHSSGPRSNAYSGNKFTNRRYYDPFALEVASAFKRFNNRIPEAPEAPWTIVLPPHTGFIHPCNREQIERKLSEVPRQFIEGLRAIFVLSGTNRQLRCWRGKLSCYGWYWRDCIFLHAHPAELGRFDRDSLRDHFLDHVLLHEIGHHVDRFRLTDHKTSEGFANWFATQSHAGKRTPPPSLI